jgi:glucan biosynthesis protein C
MGHHSEKCGAWQSMAEKRKTAERDKPKRRYDLDWLKVICILSVLPIHTGFIFTNSPFHIKNLQLSTTLDIITALWGISLIPLLFFISGMTARYALSYISPGEFVKSRVLRLFVPFVFGLLTHVSISTYYQRLDEGAFSGSFWEWYPQHYQGWFGYGGNFPWWGHHLYFLLALFVYSLIALPLFLYLRGEKAQAWLPKAAALLRKPLAVFLLMLPIALIEFTDPLSRNGFPRMGGWHMFSYFFFLVYGYIFACHKDFEQVIRQQVIPLMPVAVLGAAGAIASYITSGMITTSTIICAGLYGWSMLFIALWLAGRHLNRSSKILAYLGQVALPIYIIHQAILVPIAYYVVRWNLSIAAKYLIIIGLSYPAVFAAAEIIRRFGFLRPLFGLPLRQPARYAEPSPGVP